MRVKKNTIKKMVRKQMLHNALGRRYDAWVLDCYNYDDADYVWAKLAKLRQESRRVDAPGTYGMLEYSDYFSGLMPGDAFRWLSKVEYDAKFIAAIRNRMPEILRDTADNLAARILEQLPDGYWKP